MKKFPEGLRIILKEMCSRVNVDPETIDFSEENWFLKHQWSYEEQEDFRNWLETQFMNNPKIYKSLFGRKLNKRQAQQESGMFILNYGWKTFNSLSTENKYRSR